MKKTIATIALAGAAVSSVQADYLSDLSIAGTFAYESQYVYRASLLARESFQPSVEFGYPILGGDFYTGVWTNQPIDNRPAPPGGAGALTGNEIDFYFGYSYAVTDIFTVDGGFTYYWYPDASGPGAINQTRELYVGVSADVLLSPAVYFYYDFDLEQTLIEFSIGYSLDLGEYLGTEGISFDTGAYLGILNTGDTNAGGQVGPGKPSNGYTYFGITGDLVYAFNDNVSSSLGVRFSTNNDGDGAGVNFFGAGVGENQLWFGATLGFAY